MCSTYASCYILAKAAFSCNVHSQLRPTIVNPGSLQIPQPTPFQEHRRYQVVVTACDGAKTPRVSKTPPSPGPAKMHKSHTCRTTNPHAVAPQGFTLIHPAQPSILFSNVASLREPLGIHVLVCPVCWDQPGPAQLACRRAADQDNTVDIRLVRRLLFDPAAE